jgi:hypothetical protein
MWVLGANPNARVAEPSLDRLPSRDDGRFRSRRSAVHPSIVARWLMEHAGQFVCMLPVTSLVMSKRCSICDDLIAIEDGPSVPTADGLFVHAQCADREASTAWTYRQIYALVHAVLILTGVVVLEMIHHPVEAVAVLALGIVTHAVVHRRWWHAGMLHLRRVWQCHTLNRWR